MTAAVFVDTNVFVYARDASERVKQPRARQWLEHLWAGRSGRTSMQVVSEYYVIVTSKLAVLSADEAWSDVAEMLAWNPQPIDEDLIRRSREVQRRHRLDWWDSLIIAAAQLQGCALLLSEDFRDGGVYGNVTVRSPFTLAAHEPLAAYGSPPKQGHPPRGRPKKVPAAA